ncbi:MAG TPA: SIMPL domain-containing protein [Caulobacteraceae bacterium]|nr:SIMPL domain-containing protein [Caulobacteraceae bacterium]
MKASRVLPLLAVFAAAPLAPTLAQDHGPPFTATTLHLSAYGETSLPPDQASFDVGVETTAPTAVAAARANADRMSQVVAALKSAGAESRDLQTAQLSLAPQYAYEAGQPPRLTGYQATNQVRVTVRDLAKLARIADFATSAGATNLGQVSLGLANPAAAENSARVAAVKALEDKAAVYAQATGYRVVRLVRLSEGTEAGPAPPRPMYMAMAAQKVATPTPVEAGEVKVRVDIDGVFELAK